MYEVFPCQVSLVKLSGMIGRQLRYGRWKRSGAWVVLPDDETNCWEMWRKRYFMQETEGRKWGKISDNSDVFLRRYFLPAF